MKQIFVTCYLNDNNYLSHVSGGTSRSSQEDFFVGWKLSVGKTSFAQTRMDRSDEQVTTVPKSWTVLQIWQIIILL